MPSRKVNPDLVKERNKATFNVEEFTNWWSYGEAKKEERRALEKEFLEDPELEDEIPVSYMSHKELYEHSIKKATLVAKKLRELQEQGRTSVDNYTAILGGSIGSAIIKEGNPMAIHFVMFLPTIMGQGTSEQQYEWLSRAFSCDIIGTYAQTELGHGTFIRGLETRADYDPKTEEFILNTPTLTAYKWWPGGLGHTANYAVVIAQLYTRGQNHGIQPFIVQLRDEDTHMPMPGIDIGDIGTKLGMKSANNGYLGLKNVRIPRNNMLMKNAQVLADGTFVKSPSSVLTYGTMVFVRVVIIRDAAYRLAKAVTIATRYSAIRHQSPIEPSEPEPQVIDHITQRLKLFPEICRAIVYKFAGDYIWDMYNHVTGDLEQGNLDRLPELHSLSCVLKALSSSDTTNGIEVCRMACGGHGYMDQSAFPTIYGLSTAACTYEGENTVMLLQTSRYLLKAWSLALKGENLVPSVAYLAEVAKNKTTDFIFDGSLTDIVRAMEFVAANKIKVAYEHLEQRKCDGMTQEQAANYTGIELTQASALYGRAFLARTAYQTFQNSIAKVSPALGEILKDLLELYLVEAFLGTMGDTLRFIKLNSKQIDLLQERLEMCLHKIRPNAVAIVDGFDIHDRVLDSTLGSYDGNVYERIFEAAKKNPLNHEPVNKSFHMYLKPFMKSNL